ncbi:hypothetical protein C5Y93_28115 [Blastopirellula marina]|uniref:Uncharacterized protein n=2 Tax=Blastopirellula marina TaxID=124 RepID=A0A2S8GDP8_9BACT|nr:hypothetical protein C5Y93_28115 [Blastopirellula marina]
MLLTAILMVFGLTLFAYVAAITLRALFGGQSSNNGDGWRVIDVIITLLELLSLVDFDPPNRS